MKHMSSTSSHFDFDIAQQGDALELLQSLQDSCVAAAIFDPQHRSVLDHLKFGNEGARQIGRAALPAMSEAYIDLCIREIGGTLIPSGYLFLWADPIRSAWGLTCGWQTQSSASTSSRGTICTRGWANARADAAIMCSRCKRNPSPRRPGPTMRSRAAGPKRSTAKFTRTSSPRN